STIYHQVRDLRLELGADAHYALFVEFGTRWMQARPFLRPSLESHRDDLAGAVRKAYTKTAHI
ncbi:MAG: HK97-gp10 family putative phage morphogenesis protein, partial [Candidatus Bathyarchaeia archaeon]